MPEQPGSRHGGPILIVEDDARFRAHVTEVLSQAGFATEAVATGEQALAASRGERPVLVLLDVRLPGLSGYEVCHVLREEFGEALPILFMSGERVESFDRVAGLLLGADDYMTKPFAPDELVVRVQSLLRRGAPGVPARMSRLTRRELEVLRLLAEGRNQREIAEALVISPKTVGTHIEHILEKLGVRSRAQAVAIAYQEDRLGAPA